MIFNGPVYIYKCTVNNNEPNHTHQDRKDAAEEVGYEELKRQTTTANASFDVNARCSDYSGSPFLRHFSNPEKAPLILEWLHRVIKYQVTDREIIRPLKAAVEKGHLTWPIPYEDFRQEFGDIVSQTRYSRLMGNEGKYKNKELKLVLESLKL